MSRGHGEKLTRKQEAAIAALLACPTIRAAAAAISVNEGTIRGWLKIPAFALAYREARRQVVEVAIARLQQLTGNAADVLGEVLDDEEADTGEKIRAAVAIIDRGVKGVETADLLARLEAMEQQLRELLGGEGDGESAGEAADGAAGGGSAPSGDPP
jgi:hypothetical protein